MQAVAANSIADGQPTVRLLYSPALQIPSGAMRSVNDKNFLNAFQLLYRATNRSGAARWKVGEVEWRRERHSFSGSDYAVSLEVHCLGGAGWTLMVFAEHWWDGGQNLLKTQTWARVLDGNPKAVLAWMRAQETR